MSDEAVQRLVDIEEIKQLKAKYLRCVDTKDWSGWAEVLTEDVHFESGPAVFDGRDAVIAAVSAALAGVVTVHQGHMPEITITGPDTAEGIWELSERLIYSPEAHPRVVVGAGHYDESYVRTADGWRIARSLVTRLWRESQDT